MRYLTGSFRDDDCKFYCCKDVWSVQLLRLIFEGWRNIALPSANNLSSRGQRDLIADNILKYLTEAFQEQVPLK